MPQEPMIEQGATKSRRKRTPVEQVKIAMRKVDRAMIRRMPEDFQRMAHGLPPKPKKKGSKKS